MSQHRGYSLLVATAISDQSGLFQEAFIDLLFRTSAHYMRRGAVNLAWRSLRAEASFSQATDKTPSRQWEMDSSPVPPAVQSSAGGGVCTAPFRPEEKDTLRHHLFPCRAGDELFPNTSQTDSVSLDAQMRSCPNGGERYLAPRLIRLPTGPSLGPVTPYLGHVGTMRIFKALYVSQPSQAAFRLRFSTSLWSAFPPREAYVVHWESNDSGMTQTQLFPQHPVGLARFSNACFV